MDKDIFYDAHLHNIGLESGGFLIGLENFPAIPNTLNNEQVLQHHDLSKQYVGFIYVRKKDILKKFSHPYLKYHPRREGYSVESIISSISLNEPRCVIIDTLNEPIYSSNDYWQIAQACPSVIFIFAHSGGYLINEFIKICDFQKNVWLDFSLTQNRLAELNQDKGLPYVKQAILYSLHSRFSNRILFGSDYPDYSQNEIFNYYNQLGVLDKLNGNFIDIIDLIS